MKYIYSFHTGSAEGSKDDIYLLGGKGAHLAEMTRIGLPVPPGFTISTEVAREFFHNNGVLPVGLMDEVKGCMKVLETLLGKQFGGENPLLVSVRSGSAMSMPGMMDTILNLGLGNDPFAQLEQAIISVLQSWNSDRAVYYRKIHRIPNDAGTAVTIQAMVFGNMGETSGTGVLFTRNPATGEKVLFGEYLRNAQGEEVVAGTRNPNPVNALQKGYSVPSMEEEWPEMYLQLEEVAQKLEEHYLDMQDIEFTIEDGRLFLLQTRRAKRSAQAMIRCALDFQKSGKISREEALFRIQPHKINELLHPTISTEEKKEVIAKGLPASPGAASGQIVFSGEMAEVFHAEKKPFILMRLETSPEDIRAMNIAEGVITARGGMTSHAAVVARGIGTPCVSGCSDLEIDGEKKTCRIKGGEEILREGDWVSLDGNSGEIFRGRVQTVPAHIDEHLQTVLSWADEVRTMKVRANADTPRDAKKAIEMGAEGIGLCRTEHMFFQEDRLNIMREMILASNVEERKSALDRLLPIQQQDFFEIFEVMEGRPVTIRLIDPPLHEFLPHEEKDIEIVAKRLGKDVFVVKQKITDMSEANPMLGLRGCRLGILFPEIIEMQAEAIFRAVVAHRKSGLNVHPEIMVPLVSDVLELRHQRKVIESVYARIQQELGVSFEYLVGTMIELPRAALMADSIAEVADFFSFGTNDLTQTTFGLSRDDAGRFLPYYVEKGLFPEDPFVTLDQEGVGQLLKMAVEKGRSKNPNLKIGICGEHGGDPRTIHFCQQIGLDYVSCSPYRVPVARVAAGQAGIKI